MTIVEQLFKKIFPICSFSSRASPRSQGGSFHQRATTKWKERGGSCKQPQLLKLQLGSIPPVSV